MSNNFPWVAIASGQSNKHVPANAAFEVFDAKLSEVTSKSFTSGNVTLTDSEFYGSMIVVATDVSVARDLTLPQKKGWLVIESDAANTNDLTVKRGTTSIVLEPGEKGLFLLKGGANDLMLVAGSGLAGGGVGTSVFECGGAYYGIQQDATEPLFRFLFTSDVEFADDFAGSLCILGAATTGAINLDIKKGSSSVGTIAFGSADTTGTITSSGAVTFAPGDLLTIFGPATADATAADFTFTLKGTRT